MEQMNGWTIFQGCNNIIYSRKLINSDQNYTKQMPKQLTSSLPSLAAQPDGEILRTMRPSSLLEQKIIDKKTTLRYCL